MSDRPLGRYTIAPGQPPRFKQTSVERGPGAEVYFAPRPAKTIVDETGRQRFMVFSWIRGGGPGWLPVDILPADLVAALTKSLRSCRVGRQVGGGCVRTPSYRGRHKRVCHFRAQNLGAYDKVLKYGFVFPRPNFSPGQVADSEDILAHYFLRPMGLYNIGLNLPAPGASGIAHDIAQIGDPFFLHPSKHATQKAPVFFAGSNCPKTFINWVYGAPAKQNDANSPDWSRAGWTPLATLQC